MWTFLVPWIHSKVSYLIEDVEDTHCRQGACCQRWSRLTGRWTLATSSSPGHGSSPRMNAGKWTKQTIRFALLLSLDCFLHIFNVHYDKVGLRSSAIWLADYHVKKLHWLISPALKALSSTFSSICGIGGTWFKLWKRSKTIPKLYLCVQLSPTNSSLCIIIDLNTYDRLIF